MDNTLSVMLAVAVLAVTISMLVAVVIKLMTAVLSRSTARTAAPVEAAIPTMSPAVDDGRPPAEHVAVIAAAVTVAFDDDVQIVRIEPSRQDVTWAAAGLQAHHASHNLGPRKTQRWTSPRPRDN